MNQSLKELMQKEKYTLTSIDLFAGPGGLATGFKWAGILPLIAIEWAPGTAQTYAINQNAQTLDLSKIQEKGYLELFLKESTQPVLIYGDINQVSNELIDQLLKERYGIDSTKEPINVVSGGAPCESFSLAGKRIEGDQRDSLFKNILRVAKGTNADVILFENVKGLLSKAGNGIKGKIFESVCDEFEKKDGLQGYHLVSRDPKKIILKAADYGVPQNRERLFLIALKDQREIQFSYPKKKFGEGTGKPYLSAGQAILDLPIVKSGQEATNYTYPDSFDSIEQKNFIDIMRGKYDDPSLHAKTPEYLSKLYSESSLSSHRGPGHIKRKMELLELIPPEESMKSIFAKFEEDGTLEKVRHLFPKIIYGSRNRRLIKNQPSFTVTSHCLDEILHPYLNRAITPREAARLQSFPDWYQFTGPYVVFHSSHTQDRYEQIGDAIPPLLAHAIAVEIIKALN